jgi:hypothetical protein
VKKPIGVAIDPGRNHAYVRYREARIARTVSVWLDGHVAADLDLQGLVVGVKVCALDSCTLAYARHYAATHDLAFPAFNGYEKPVSS